MTYEQAEELISRISKHIQTYYFSYEEIYKIFETVPDHVKYHGTAYRLVLNIPKHEIDQDVSKNLFWAKSIEALSHYIRHSSKNETNDTVIEAHVVGIDLNKLIDYLNLICDDKPKFNNPYDNEEEILAISFIMKNL